MKSAREAKEFLVSQIVLEAQRQGATLSEVEQKMLYFSESGWTLPDMLAVSDEFDSAYDQAKYEKKIVRLIRGAYKAVCRDDRAIYDEWWTSIRLLNKEDHYLSVMTRLASLRPRHDQLKLFGTALVLAVVSLFAIFVAIKYDIHFPTLGRLHAHASLAEYIWAAGACLFIIYQVLRFVIGAKQADDLVAKLARQFARLSNRVR